MKDRRVPSDQQRADALLSRRLKSRVTVILDEDCTMHLQGDDWHTIRPMYPTDSRLWEYGARSGQIIQTRRAG